MSGPTQSCQLTQDLEDPGSAPGELEVGLRAGQRLQAEEAPEHGEHYLERQEEAQEEQVRHGPQAAEQKVHHLDS